MLPSIRLAVITAIPLAVASQVNWAQDRMPPLDSAELTEDQRQAVQDFEAVRGYSPRGPWIPLLRSPEVLNRARAMGDYLRFASTLPPRLSELVILITAREWSQQYEWNAHYPEALKGGLRREVADAIAEGRRPESLAADESALYALVGELLRNKRISDATYDRAVELFGEKGVIDAVGIVGYYSLIAMILNTAQTPLPAGAEPGLPSLP